MSLNDIYINRKNNRFKIFTALVIAFQILNFVLPSTLLSTPSNQRAQEIRAQIEALEKLMEERKKALADVDSQLEQLNMQLEIATEKWKEAEDQLQRTRTRQNEVRLKAEEIQRDLQRKQDIFSKRIRILYKEGNFQILSVLLNSENIGDLLTRLHYILLITKMDSELVTSIKNKKVELEKIQIELQEMVEEEQRALYEIQIRKIAIQSEQQRLENYRKSLSIETQQLLAQIDDLMRQQQELYRSYYYVIPEAFGLDVEPGSIVETALKYLGVPYLWGGEKPSTGFDCSGLVRYVFLQHGIELPHYSGYQFKMGKPVEKNELQPGDLVFFGNPVHHVGIYVGNGYFIHAPKTGDFVKLTLLESRKDYAGARRILGYVLPTVTPAH